ncbi:MAG TPA: glycosyltransferase family 1 protein [Candidatus Moranbacteria bacterium]|nr:glycosyltransferase family 1 protein [Candidatus Moranbacteria bacterium]
MKIGIDARSILNPEKGDAIGVGHYTYQLIRHLLQIDKENEYVILFDFHAREKDIKKFKQPNVKIKFYPFSDYKKYLPGAYNEILGTATLAREHLDVVHSTSATNRIPTAYRGKMIVTVHDLASYKVPDVFPKIKTARIKAVTKLMVGKADKVIAVSESTKKDICDIFGCEGEKVKVIYSGLDKRFFEEPAMSREKIMAKFGISNNGTKYILFLGTLEPVKNISRLFEAYKIMREKLKKEIGKCEYKLVMAGKRGWLAEEYKKMAKDMEIGKDVIFTGYVIGDEIVPMFKNAEFFVMPSLYEGFGTTVLEAFAAGTPAIVSNVSSIPEIAGDAAILVNPIDIKEIADAMLKLAKDDKLCYDLRQKGFEQVKKFDWEKTARETLEVYKSVK